jgi:hypothetical protein
LNVDTPMPTAGTFLRIRRCNRALDFRDMAPIMYLRSGSRRFILKALELKTE